MVVHLSLYFSQVWNVRTNLDTIIIFWGAFVNSFNYFSQSNERFSVVLMSRESYNKNNWHDIKMKIIIKIILRRCEFQYRTLVGVASRTRPPLTRSHDRTSWRWKFPQSFVGRCTAFSLNRFREIELISAPVHFILICNTLCYTWFLFSIYLFVFYKPDRNPMCYYVKRNTVRVSARRNSVNLLLALCVCVFGMWFTTGVHINNVVVLFASVSAKLKRRKWIFSGGLGPNVIHNIRLCNALFDCKKTSEIFWDWQILCD